MIIIIFMSDVNILIVCMILQHLFYINCQLFSFSFIGNSIIYTLCISIIICNMLFIQTKLNNKYVLISTFKMIVPSNEVCFCTTSDAKNSSYPRIMH